MPDDFNDDKAVCHEIGAAVLVAIAGKRELSIKTLIELNDEAITGGFSYSENRVLAMKKAREILQAFLDHY